MPKSENQKLKLLYLMKMLLDKTDEEHTLTVPEMIAELSKYEIKAERKSIYDDIDRLEKTEVKLRRFTIHTPLFQWPLLTALGLFALEMLLANTRLRRVP